MKKSLSGILLLSSLVILNSCSKDDNEKNQTIVSDFEYVVTGEAPNAVIKLTNKSVNANDYKWKISEGTTNIGDSLIVEESPSVNVDRVGSMNITLVATKKGSAISKEVTKTITITGKSAVNIFKDVALSNSTSGPIPRFFSTKLGKAYISNETSFRVANIDLAFSSLGTSVNYFSSPDSHTDGYVMYNDPSVTHTIIQNYVTSGFSATDFDAATNDEKIKAVTVNDDGESFPESGTFPMIVLFQNGSGLKGAVKVKSISNGKIITDIMVQKYK